MIILYEILDTQNDLSICYCFTHLDAALRRNGMGYYMYSPEKGEIPLTVLDVPTPGPGQYDPDYTKHSRFNRNPEYSIRPWTKLSKTIS